MLMLPNERHHARIIALEGIDGAGKTEQTRRLAERLQLEMPSTEIVTVREPGATAGGEAIRNLLHEQRGQLNPVTELFLFNAARCQLMQEVILPALKRGAIVIADRYVASSWAYQTTAILRPDITPEYVEPQSVKDIIRDICMYATNGGLYPGITILLTCDDDDLDVFFARQSTELRRDREYLLDVRERYSEMADQEHNWHEVIYAGDQATPDDIAAEIAALVLKHLDDTRR